MERKVYEKNSNVKLLLNNPEHATAMTEALQKAWETEDERIQKEIAQRVEEIKQVQESIRNEADPQKKKALFTLCMQAQSSLNEQCDNLTGMEQQALYTTTDPHATL